MAWPLTVSLGKLARSSSRTCAPARARSIAVGAPAQRAPTTIASYVAVEEAMRPLSRTTRPRPMQSRQLRPANLLACQSAPHRPPATGAVAGAGRRQPVAAHAPQDRRTLLYGADL